MYLPANSVVPPSQKDRRISVIAPWGTCDLNLRPEDLTWQEPSRISVVQTLGGAWLDAFGPGVAQISIAGNTGWKVSPGWEAQFQKLHQVSFKGWHEFVEQTKAPEKAEMLFADDLDGRVVQVAPLSFTLKRNKSKPLLMQYNIVFLAVRDAEYIPADTPMSGGVTASLAPILPTPTPDDALASLANQINRAQAVLAALQSPSAGGLLGVLSQVSPQLAEAIAGVMGVIAPGLALARSIVGDSGEDAPVPNELATAIEQSAAALATGLGHVMPNVPAAPESAGAVLSLAADMRIVACLFSAAFRASLLQYPDYEPLYGSSNCSSTSGGRPLSVWRDLNPFEVMLPVPERAAEVDVEAARSAIDLAGSDPALDPWPITRVADSLATVARGTRIREVY